MSKTIPASYRFGRSSCHHVSDPVELGVNVFVNEAVPLVERVQRTQDGHDLLGQRAAVSGCQRRLWAGLPLAQGTICGPKDIWRETKCKCPCRFGRKQGRGLRAGKEKIYHSDHKILFTFKSQIFF